MRDQVIGALKVSGLSKTDLENLIEIPKNSEMGDFAFPTFSLAKKFKKNPAEIAKDLANKIESNNFEKVEAVEAYVNFFVDRKKLSKVTVREVLNKGNRYGSKKKNSEKFMIEFSQPNTHKAFHVGHVRGTSIGESLARISEFVGNKTFRTNYSGDTGMHIAKWLWCYLKYHKKEKLRSDEAWFASIYVDAVKRLGENEDLQKEVDAINQKLDSRSDKELVKLWEKTRKLSIDSWKNIYSQLNTKFNTHFFESEAEQPGKKIAQGLVKKKIAIISDGAAIMDLEKYSLGIWVLLRRDGTVLYSAKDLALADQKFKKYGKHKSLVITDSSQDLHFKQLEKTLELMKFKHTKSYSHLSYGSIRFPWGKMSSRTGDNVLYSDFIKQLQGFAQKEISKREKLTKNELDRRSAVVAIASIKYAFLKQDVNRNIIFDPKKSISFEGNTGSYLLYSYARAKSILKKAKYKKKDKFEIDSVNDSEKELVSEISRFPEVVEHAYRNLSPNIIANYAYDLAKTFSEFYHHTKVIGSKEEKFRLSLVDCFAQSIKNALDLLGIEVIEEM